MPNLLADQSATYSESTLANGSPTPRANPHNPSSRELTSSQRSVPSMQDLSLEDHAHIKNSFPLQISAFKHKRSDTAETYYLLPFSPSTDRPGQPSSAAPSPPKRSSIPSPRTTFLPLARPPIISKPSLLHPDIRHRALRVSRHNLDNCLLDPRMPSPTPGSPIETPTNAFSSPRSVSNPFDPSQTYPRSLRQKLKSITRGIWLSTVTRFRAHRAERKAVKQQITHRSFPRPTTEQRISKSRLEAMYAAEVTTWLAQQDGISAGKKGSVTGKIYCASTLSLSVATPTMISKSHSDVPRRRQQRQAQQGRRYQLRSLVGLQASGHTHFSSVTTFSSISPTTNSGPSTPHTMVPSFHFIPTTPPLADLPSLVARPSIAPSLSETEASFACVGLGGLINAATADDETAMHAVGECCMCERLAELASGSGMCSECRGESDGTLSTEMVYSTHLQGEFCPAATRQQHSRDSAPPTEADLLACVEEELRQTLEKTRMWRRQLQSWRSTQPLHLSATTAAAARNPEQQQEAHEKHQSEEAVTPTAENASTVGLGISGLGQTPKPANGKRHTWTSTRTRRAVFTRETDPDRALRSMRGLRICAGRGEADGWDNCRNGFYRFHGEVL